VTINIRLAGCMFDNLDPPATPRDSVKTNHPRPAHIWEIGKDGKTYTFQSSASRRLLFHDGLGRADSPKMLKATSIEPQSPIAAGDRDPAQLAVQGGVEIPRPTNTPCSFTRPIRGRSILSCRRSPR